MEKIRQYYQLAKPGIIYGNLLTATAGFLFGSKFHGDWRQCVIMLVGTALTIASACVYNNILDRGIDKKMQRTRKRALVTGEISQFQAVVYATILGMAGLLLLALWSNMVVFFIGVVAFLDYVVLYGYTKRTTVHGTLVGSISGSAPLVAGYAAATNRFDLTALLLFLIMAAWQMAHFYAIAMYRASDYKKAGIPVLPVVHGMKATKTQILAYIGAFVAVNVLLFLQHSVGYFYVIVMGLMGCTWLWLGLRRLAKADDVKWGKQMFFYSLNVLLVLSVALSVGPLLP